MLSRKFFLILRKRAFLTRTGGNPQRVSAPRNRLSDDEDAPGAQPRAPNRIRWSSAPVLSTAIPTTAEPPRNAVAGLPPLDRHSLDILETEALGPGDVLVLEPDVLPSNCARHTGFASIWHSFHLAVHMISRILSA